MIVPDAILLDEDKEAFDTTNPKAAKHETISHSQQFARTSKTKSSRAGVPWATAKPIV
jgi:hypothetical protein